MTKTVPAAHADDIRAAKEWIMDCAWVDITDESDLDEYTDVQIQRAVNRAYDGGWMQFLRDSE